MFALKRLKASYCHEKAGSWPLPAFKRGTLSVRAYATVPAADPKELAGTRIVQKSSITSPRSNGQEGYSGQSGLRVSTAAPMPGPPSVELSSGADFIDLIHVDETEAHQRLQDAQTFKMLGCSAGVLRLSRDDVASAAHGSGGAAFNVRKLRAFRDNVTRNLAPTVARGFVDARRASATSAGAAPAGAACGPRSVAANAASTTSGKASSTAFSTTTSYSGFTGSALHVAGHHRHHPFAPAAGSQPALSDGSGSGSAAGFTASPSNHSHAASAARALSRWSVVPNHPSCAPPPPVDDTFPPLFASLEAPTSPHPELLSSSMDFGGEVETVPLEAVWGSAFPAAASSSAGSAVSCGAQTAAVEPSSLPPPPLGNSGAGGCGAGITPAAGGKVDAAGWAAGAAAAAEIPTARLPSGVSRRRRGSRAGSSLGTTGCGRRSAGHGGGSAGVAWI